MTKIYSIGRWFLIAACAFEGILFCFIAYVAYCFDRAFHSQWESHNLFQNLIFLVCGVTGLYSSFAIFKRRPRAKYLSGILLLGVTILVLVEYFSYQPHAWLELMWGVPPALAFSYLVFVWTKSEFWQVRQPS
jgi:peptidoglycan/LPS O-acetylase OafA/YrhL